MSVGRNHKSNSEFATTANLKVVAIREDTPPHIPPTGASFVSRLHRESIYAAWRNRRASIRQLARRNSGFGESGIEEVLRSELDRLDLQRERLSHAVSHLTRRAA